MKIEIKTNAYNARRYGRNWIANIKLDGTKFIYEFGDWIGVQGGEGLLVLDAKGSVFACGQRDYRGSNTENEFYKILDDEGNFDLITRVEAYKILSESKQ